MEYRIFHDSKLNPHAGGMQVFNRTITGQKQDKARTMEDIRLSAWDLVKRKEHCEQDAVFHSMENKFITNQKPIEPVNQPIEPSKEDLTTLVEIVNKLHKDGYETQFKIAKAGLESTASGESFTPQQVAIKSFYRFEGDSSTDDNAIVYAIETNTGEKGTLIDSYGTYSDPLLARFIKDVEEIQKKEVK